MKNQPSARYNVGQQVYILGRPQTAAYEVVAHADTAGGWPHYIVQNVWGEQYRVPRIHCSTKPIV